MNKESLNQRNGLEKELLDYAHKMLNLELSVSNESLTDVEMLTRRGLLRRSVLDIAERYKIKA